MSFQTNGNVFASVRIYSYNKLRLFVVSVVFVYSGLSLSFSSLVSSSLARIITLVIFRFSLSILFALEFHCLVNLLHCWLIQCASLSPGISCFESQSWWSNCHSFESDWLQLYKVSLDNSSLSACLMRLASHAPLIFYPYEDGMATGGGLTAIRWVRSPCL